MRVYGAISPIYRSWKRKVSSKRCPWMRQLSSYLLSCSLAPPGIMAPSKTFLPFEEARREGGCPKAVCLQPHKSWCTLEASAVSAVFTRVKEKVLVKSNSYSSWHTFGRRAAGLLLAGVSHTALLGSISIEVKEKHEHNVRCALVERCLPLFVELVEPLDEATHQALEGRFDRLCSVFPQDHLLESSSAI